MNVLVACECSQTVCKEFRALGHETYSCDIEDQYGGHHEKIGFYKKKLENTMDMLEFLDTFECCIISLTGCSDDEGYRECVPMPLRDTDMIDVVAMIEKKLENQVIDYDDEIVEAYQELDELLK